MTHSRTTTDTRESSFQPLPPRYKAHRPWSIIKQMQRDPIAVCMDATRRCGDINRVLDLGPIRVVSIASPEGVRHVLQENWQNYEKRTRGYANIRMLLGNGLITSEGELWRRQRRILMPPFQRRNIKVYSDVITHATNTWIERWETREELAPLINISAEMAHLVLHIVGETLLGKALLPHVKEVRTALDVLVGQMRQRTGGLTLPLWIPTPLNYQFKRARAALQRIVRDIIRVQRQMPMSSNLLSLMINAIDEETGAAMDEQQIEDEVMTFMVAGHETTATTLVWALYLLAQHPTVLAQAKEEIARELGDGPMTFEAVPRLTWVTQIVEEAMRLYPPAWGIARRAVEDDLICGFRIPAKTLVLLGTYVTHRNPDIWTDPDAFHPERFAPAFAEKRPKFAYFPFSGGPRVCVGGHFSMMMTVQILAMLLQRYDFKLLSPHPIKPVARLTLQPEHDLLMRLSPRI